MGYRSDVVAVFYTTSTQKEAQERNEAKLKLFMDENFPAELKKPEWGGDDEGLTMLEHRIGTIYEFKISSVKWYETYRDVQAFEEFWNKFIELADGKDEGAEDPPEWACEFIRLGENDDDIETRTSYNPAHVLSVSRTIVIDR